MARYPNRCVELFVFLLLSVAVRSQFTNLTADIGLIDFGTVPCSQLRDKALDYKLLLNQVFTSIKVITLNLPMMTNDEIKTSLVDVNQVSAIIFNYNHKLAVATHTAGLPYLLTSKNLNLVLPDNMFWIDQMNTDLAIATASLLNSVKASTRLSVIVSDQFEDLHIFTDTLQGLFIPFDILQYYPSIPDEELKNQLRRFQAPYSDSATFIVLLSESEMENLTRIFSAAVYVGAMNLNQLWIIPSLNVPPHLFNSVRHTKTRFVTYALADDVFNSTKESKNALCEDAVRQLMKATATNNVNTTLLEKMKTVSYSGTHGEFRYNSSRIRVGNNINYKSPYRNADSSFDSKLKTVGVWSSKTSRADINDTEISRKSFVLRLGVVMDKPFFIKTHGTYSGYFYELMSRIAKKNNWILDWKIAENYGVYNSINKTWDGLMQMVVDDEIDVAVGYLLATKERRKVMDFSEPLFRFGFTTLALKPPPTILWFIFIYPFGLWVWIGLAAAFIIQSITFFCVDRLSLLFNEDVNRTPYTFSESIFNIFITFGITKYPIRPTTFSTRFFMIVAWFAALVILASYVANFVPHLMKKENVPPSYRYFTTLINNTEDYKWFFATGDATVKTLEESSVLLERQLVQKAKTKWINKMYANASQASEVMRQDYKLVYITDQSHATYMAKQDCNFETGKGMINIQPGYMAYSKKFVFAKQINDSLSSFQATGVLDELYRIWVSFGQPCSKELALQIEDVAVIFIVLAAGTVIGIIVGIFEVLVKACAICCLRLRLKKLEFGKLYNAEIIDIENDGVRVNVNGRPKKYFLHNSQLHPDPIKNKNAQSLNLRDNQKMKVRYFGKDPINKSKYFVRETQT